MTPDEPGRAGGRRVPVQASKGHPRGTLAWEEHVQAWEDYDKRYRGQDAETIARRGGFSYGELVYHLARNPTTWEPTP